MSSRHDGQRQDSYHGVRVRDPYRWLEDTGSVECRRFLEEQTQRTRTYLEASPARATVRQRLLELFDFQRFGVPIRRGPWYVFTVHDGLTDQPVIYASQTLGGPARVVLDINLQGDGGNAVLARFDVSPDGRYLAYGFSRGGSDWQEWRVCRVEDGRELPDHVRWVKFTGAEWAPDGSGFYYGRFDRPRPGGELAARNIHHRLWFHRLGTRQEEDLLVHERPDRPELGFTPVVTEDGGWLTLQVWDGSDPRTGFTYRALDRSGDPWVELFPPGRARFELVGSDGRRFWFLTDLEAPRGRLVEVDLEGPRPELWRDVIPETGETLEQVVRVGDHFLSRYLRDARAVLRLSAPDGRPLQELPLPEMGSVTGLDGRNRDRETFFTFCSFAIPPVLYRFDLGERRLEVVRRPWVAFDPADYVTGQVFFESRDGTRIPMFLAHRRDLPLTGEAPVQLCGYGGFKVAVTPSFSPANLAWMELGGVLAVANVRGGGEYGEDWHRAAVGVHKQRSFDDFQAAARWLVDRGYTRPERLAIAGCSNGGLLVGACLTQRPELFGAALLRVGVLDMLRFHKFTIGWAWVSDYGSPEDPEEFRALYAYSPYHNIRPGTVYPATLVITADHDDRVVPWHSYKFAAALQAAQAGGGPILLRVEERAGHGVITPIRKRLEQALDELTFLVDALGVDSEELPTLIPAAVPGAGDHAGELPGVPGFWPRNG
jgi:prolyl oligopeptidase